MSMSAVLRELAGVTAAVATVAVLVAGNAAALTEWAPATELAAPSAAGMATAVESEGMERVGEAT